MHNSGGQEIEIECLSAEHLSIDQRRVSETKMDLPVEHVMHMTSAWCVRSFVIPTITAANCVTRLGNGTTWHNLDSLGGMNSPRLPIGGCKPNLYMHSLISDPTLYFGRLATGR